MCIIKQDRNFSKSNMKELLFEPCHVSFTFFVLEQPDIVRIRFLSAESSSINLDSSPSTTADLVSTTIGKCKLEKEKRTQPCRDLNILYPYQETCLCTT